MTVDLSKVVLSTSANSFKNDGVQYSGSIALPSSLTSTQTYIATQTITLDEQPQYSKFYAQFYEVTDAIFNSGNYTNLQWYPANVGGWGQVAVHTTTSPFTGAFGGFIYPVINAGTILVTLRIVNPYSATIALTSYTIPWTFIIYSLAN
jgi:hypothetical protein